MKRAVYTAIFDNYDTLREPLMYNKNWDYYCFTNLSLKSKRWKVIKVKSTEEGAKNARKIKILGHEVLKGYDVTIWHDGNLQIDCDPEDLLMMAGEGTDLASMKHGCNCVYVECQNCLNAKKDDPATILNQIAKYQDEGYPHDNGLIASGILIRWQSKDMSELMEMWWNEVKNHSKRDQLSFNYALWKFTFLHGDKIKTSTIPLSVMHTHFNKHPHRL